MEGRHGGVQESVSKWNPSQVNDGRPAFHFNHTALVRHGVAP